MPNQILQKAGLGRQPDQRIAIIRFSLNTGRQDTFPASPRKRSYVGFQVRLFCVKNNVYRS